MKAQSNTLAHPIKPLSLPKTSAMDRFYAWTNRMDYYRLIILAGIILAQGCVTGPFSLWVMNLIGDNVLQMSVFTLSSFAMLTFVLADQPMRRTLPVFFVLTGIQWLITLINLIVFM